MLLDIHNESQMTLKVKWNLLNIEKEVEVQNGLGPKTEIQKSQNVRTYARTYAQDKSHSGPCIDLSGVCGECTRCVAEQS